jgi:hypothetical protein
MTTGRNHRDIGDFEGDGDHWVAIGVACDRLLERLVKHHEKKTAPVAKQEPFEEGSGHG